MKIGITGINGFIGSALAKRFSNDEVYSYPRKDLDYLFLFGSPSSNIIFDQNIDYCFEETIGSFLNAIQYCRDNDIRLIYPSSATVYNKNTSYARCKAVLEEIHQAYGGDVLGIRIAAGYGYEESKGEYASVVYQFCKAMKKGDRPVIYGDGKQTRDFIYIDDIVDRIIRDKDLKGIIEYGTGVNTSFNRLVRIINDKLGTKIKPIYRQKPKSYVESTNCNESSSFIHYQIEDGIDRILKQL